MKKFLQITLVMLAICLLTFPALAQITITKSNYAFKTGIDSFQFHLDGSKVSLPETGPDKTYDYSDLNIDEDGFVNYINPSGDPTFTSATHSRFGVYSVNGLIFRSLDFSEVANSGYKVIGRRQYDTTHSITMLTGGANDVMHFPDADIVFNSPRYAMIFPFTYGDSYTKKDLEISKYNLTVGAFALSNTPGEIHRWTIQKREAVGYGKLILPDGNGGSFNPFDVLLVHVIDSIIDSVFLGGQPAPPALLAAFNFTQGRLSVVESMNFEMEGFGRQPLGMYLDDMGNVDYAYMRIQAADLFVGKVPILSATNISVFPNPVSSGSILNIKGLSEVLAIQLIDMNGRAYPLQKNISGQMQVPHLGPGFYLLQIRNADGMTITNQKILVN